MKTWSAGQISQSNGAYSGRDVAFTIRGTRHGGVLTRSDRAADGAPYTYLWVDGEMFTLVNTTPVEVA